MLIVPPQREKRSIIEQLEERRLLSSPETAALIAADSPATVVAAPLASPQAEAQTMRTPKAPLPETIFAHPSILHTETDFDRMRAKVNAGAQPWLAGWNALTSDGYSGTGWTPRASQTVIRGGDGSNFAGMVIDMQRAYQTAVRWKVSGDTAFANQSIQILNAWSSTHTVLGGNADRFLASGLYGFGWAAAADIMRSYSGWAAEDVTRFQNYLLNIYYPMQDDFLYGGDDAISHNGAAITNYWANWDLANIEGMMAIGIFTDRQDIYDRAVNYLYGGGGNGALDRAFYYLHPGNLMQFQESGRDQGHTTLGMGLFGHIAQMAWNQGLDLFAYNNYQFLASAEYVAKYNLFLDVPYQTYMWGTGQSGAWQQQTDLGGGSRGNGRPVYELIYNHYVNRLGMQAKYSTQRVLGLRPEWRGNGDEFGFGTLTNALDPASTGLAPRGLTAAEKGAGNVQLDWFGSSNATHYNVYRATSENGAFTQIASDITDLLSYTDTNLPAGIYYYKVAGVVGAGETGLSDIVSATSTSLLHTQLAFNEASGVTAADSSGNAHNGTLNGDASWTTGKTGNAISLNGSNGYVSLPEDVAADVDDFTIATWVYLNDSRMWSRIFDFGETRPGGNSQPTPERWMFLTPRNGGGVVEFATSTVYGYNKQWVAGNAALPTNQWVHVAVTLSRRVGTLYVNGVPVGTNVDMAFPPSQIRVMNRNWIGRSQYGNDPYLNGRVDDFRIYHGAMTGGEIYTLATGNAAPAAPEAPASLTATALAGNRIDLSWSPASGASSYVVKRSTSVDGPYDVIANMFGGTSLSDYGRVAGVTYYYVVAGINNGGEGTVSVPASATALPPMPATPASVSAVSNSPTSISLNWNAAANATSYTVKRSLTAGGPYTAVATGLTTTSYTDSGLTTGTIYYYVVSAVNAAGEGSNSSEASDTASDRRTRLTFHESAGTSAQDITGNGWNGTLVNGTLWGAGKMGSGIDLDGGDDHVTLPAGVVNGLTNVTLSSWINIDALATWQRIFDFGTGTDNYMFLTTQYAGSSNRLRFAIRTPSVPEQTIESTVATPLGSWAHVAVVLNEGTGTLYLNGVPRGQKTGMTLNPSSLGNTTQNYLGKSQWNDPYFNGKIDDFRIYTRALSGAEVSALVTTTLPAAPPSLTATSVGNDQVNLSWPAIAGATGYTILRATSSDGPYSIIASRLSSTSYQDSGLVPGLASGTTYYYFVQAENAAGEGPKSPQASALLLPLPPESPAENAAMPATSGSISLTWSAATNAASYKIDRATSIDGTYVTIASGVTGTSFTDSGLTNGLTYYYRVTAVNASGEAEAASASATATDLYARLKFDETTGTTAGDSSGHSWNGTLTNGAAWYASGKLNRALDLDGSNDYVALPSGIVSGLTTATLSAWVYLDSLGTSSRIFDFGNGTNTYMFLSQQSGAYARFAITTNSWGSEQQIVGNAPLPTGTWTHVAVTLNGSTGSFYVNGTKVGENAAMTLNPSSLGNTAQNYLGKSQFSSDSSMNGRIDDFRIYSRALSAAEVTTLKNSTLPTTPTGLDATAGNAQVSLNWNSVSGATGYQLSRSTSAAGPFTPIAGALAGTSYLDTDVVNGTTYYYVVSAYNIVDGSANSSSVNATPLAPVLMTGSGFAYQTLPYQLSFVFDGSRSFVAGDLTVTPAGGGTAIPASGYQWNAATNTATFNLPGPLPDGNYTASLPGGYAFNFFVLAGDADRSGAVDSTDFNLLAANYGGGGQHFGNGDFNYDGKVDTQDFNILAGRFGQAASLSAAPLATSPATMLFSTHQLDIDMEEELDEFVS